MLPLQQDQEGQALSEMQPHSSLVWEAEEPGTRPAVVGLGLAVFSVVLVVGYYYLYTPLGFTRLDASIGQWLIALPLFLSCPISFGAIRQGRRSLTASRQVQPSPRRAMILAWVAIVLGGIEIVLALAVLILMWAWVAMVPHM